MLQNMVELYLIQIFKKINKLGDILKIEMLSI
jgi:hypothetical protein